MTQVASAPARIDQDLDRPNFFIGGEWVKPAADQVVIALEAATEEVLGTAALGTTADIDRAVNAARIALDGPWGRTTVAERADVMRRFSTALMARSDTTSTLVSRENGMPIGLSHGVNGLGPAALLGMYADIALETSFEEPRAAYMGSSLVRREPVGVVGAITPWNYPQVLAMLKIAPALAAGCTVVLKPSPDAALDPYILADAALEAGLPAGVLNIVLADAEASASLVSHPLVDKIAFTGSTATGRHIGAECGRLIRRVTLELGGKSAAIFLADGDIDAFAANLPIASFMNNGQTCTTQSRILAPRSRYNEVVEAVVAVANGLVVGDPLDPSVSCGPMVTAQHRERVLSYIELGKNSSARLVAGGGRPADLDRGWFVRPTVFADVDNGDRLAREEVFGPVLAVIAYDDDDDAVAIANDSNYGLAGSVWTTDEGRGVNIARRIRTGTFGVNNYNVDLGSPTGGFKDSGIGRESGPEALHNYLEYKSIFMNSPLG